MLIRTAQRWSRQKRRVPALRAPKIAGEIDRLRAQRATRQADVERIRGMLEKTAGRVEKLRERKRS